MKGCMLAFVDLESRVPPDAPRAYCARRAALGARGSWDGLLRLNSNHVPPLAEQPLTTTSQNHAGTQALLDSLFPQPANSRNTH
jgi:hypothetical protein